MKQIIWGLFINLLLIGQAFGQNMLVKGHVTEQSGEALPGVNILIEGTTTGTTTDLDGSYVIEVPTDETNLIFSFIGMITVIEHVNARSIIDVVLEDNSVVLGEVMVVAYGTTTKEAYTGSAQIVDADVIESRPVASFEKALQGTTSGLQISSSSGQPGAASSIRIRGIGSLSASSAPLIVVDGVPFAGSISDINPNDILSVNTVKDAAGASLYGSRAANGVIIITTKKGQSGTTSISFSAQVGSNERISDGYSLMNSTDFYQQAWQGLYNKAVFDDGLTSSEAMAYANDQVEQTVGFNPFAIDNPLDNNGKLIAGTQTKTDTDWRNLIYKTGTTQNYNLSVSGGNESTTAYFSFGYYNNTGTVLSSDFERYTGKINVTHKLNKVVSSGVNSQFSSSYYNVLPNGTSAANIVRAAEVFNPATPLYAPNGDYNWFNVVTLDFNPVGLAKKDIYRGKGSRAAINAYINLQLGKDFSFRSTGAIDYTGGENITYYNPEHGNGAGVGGRGTISHSNNNMLSLSNVLNWNKQISKHFVEMLVGQETFSEHGSFLSASATDYGIPDKFHLDWAAQPETPSSSETEWGLISYLGQAKYEFDGRINVSASYRMDGSSRFGDNNKYGSFYSVGAGWTISKEPWMPEFDWFNYARLRASYGTSGNADIGNFAAKTLYYGGANYGGNPGIALGQVGNPNLSWEKQAMVNTGLELNLFDRLSLTAEYYTKESDALLYSEPLSREKGVGSILTNIGSVRNSGVELLMEYEVIKSKDLKYVVGTNLSGNKSEVLKLNGDPVQGATQLMEEGGLRYQFYMREWAGVNPDNGEPMWFTNEASDFDEANVGEPASAFKDPNGTDRMVTSSYNDAEKVRMGTALPTLFGGLNNSVSYKGFDLNLYFYFSIGGYVYNYDYAANMHDGKSPGTNLATEALNAWTPNNRYTDVPRYVQNNQSQSNDISSRFLEDASYLRLKNVSLAYNLPQSLCKKVWLKNARVFISGENLWTLTKFKGFDPEGALTGVTNNNIPGVKTYTVGVKIDL